MIDLTRPLLVLQAPTLVPTQPVRRGRGGSGAPNKARQVERLDPQFAALQAALDAKLATLSNDPGGVPPEQVLVFETNGPVNEFHQALASVQGLEWLADEELRDLPPDGDFFHKEKPEKLVNARTYLVMSNVTAVRQLVSVWNAWKKKGRAKVPDPLKAWVEVFRRLRKVRPWGVADRLEETGILALWQEQVDANFPWLEAFEIELWDRTPEGRRAAMTRVKALVSAAGGRVLDSAIIDSIAYNALFVRLPSKAVRKILDDRSVELVRSDDVRLFRPGPQGVRMQPDPSPPQTSRVAPPREPLLDPVVGLLDGLPLQNHAALAGRLVLDDPDRWEEQYPAARRRHGTAMASLILHGELNAPSTPSRHKLYCLPILLPHPLNPDDEVPPQERLWVDVIHRAVKRALEGDGNAQPVAPNVRVFNVSVGDPTQMFLRNMSPLARLLDWLAWKHKVLFIVSAGNHHREPISVSATTTAQGMEGAVLRALQAQQRNRRIIAPAETVNGLTVGASSEDASGVWRPAGSHETLLLVARGLPSPISGLGRGYRRSVKPDLLAPGGRVVYTREPEPSDEGWSFTVAERLRQPPGQLVASPAAREGDLRGERYCVGTSNAAALTTRLAEQVHDTLSALMARPEGERLREIPIALLIKAMLVHTADWPSSAYEALVAHLSNDGNRSTFKDHAAAYLGYGVARPDRAVSGEYHRATLLGGGTIAPGETWAHRIPTPSGLHTYTDWRRLTITLTWFTPIRPSDQRYRCVALSFTPPLSSPLRLERAQVHANAVDRGTVQHEVLEQESGAIDLPDDHFLDVPVTCTADAPGLELEPEGRVHYALAVTLEVAPHVRLPIYDQVLERVRPQVRP